MENTITHVGLDAHKIDHKAAMLLPGSDQPQEWVVQNQPRAIKRMIRQIKKLAPGPVLFCYEAGVCGFALKRQIEAEGVGCMVIAPSLIPIRPGQRVRTDRRDAKNLAALLRAGLLTEVHPPNEQEESVRDLCRCREAAGRDLLRVRHQVTKYLLRRGMIFREGRHWTEKHLRWLRSVRFEQPLDEEVYTNYLTELDHRAERLRLLDARVKQVAQEDPYKEPVGRLRCFQGIDTITAMIVVAELHGFGRFASPRGLMSYLGLTPSEDSSGQTRRQGGITKAGNSRVRRVLIEASWHQRHRPIPSRALRQRRDGQPAWVLRIAERAQRRLHNRYWRLVHKGKSPTKANVAVAREMAGFLWSVLHPQGRAGQALEATPPAATATDPRRQSVHEFLGVSN